uniref:Ovule protein n=1 Tax=Romanomermis culicivorax TaxID=13658 RepID=A0A915J8K9_ROMCU
MLEKLESRDRFAALFRKFSIVSLYVRAFSSSSDILGLFFNLFELELNNGHSSSQFTGYMIWKHVMINSDM